ncbi:MAG: type II secretion system protein [Alphaproteobacteria bacterium]|nr:type II secretion system protein [Alphaproteobacteria bacterium]
MHPRALILNQQGFSLAETAIALAVIAVVIGLMVPTLLSVRVAEQARATTQNLQTVMRSIAAFVQASGYVPCPIDPGAPFSESKRDCDIAVGVVPFQSLGLSQSFAKDAYGRWLTYAVDINLAKFAVTPPSKMLPVNGPDGLCSLAFSSATSLKVRLSGANEQQNIAVVLLSHGANGRGAYKNTATDETDLFPFPNTVPACSTTEGAERCNADGNISFVAGLPGQFSKVVNGTPVDDPFDDVYLYLDRNALVTYLGNQPCTTEWK